MNQTLSDQQQAEKIVELEILAAQTNPTLFNEMVRMVVTALRSERVRSANVARDFFQKIFEAGQIRIFSSDEIRDAIMEEPGSEGPGSRDGRKTRPQSAQPHPRDGG